MENKLLVVDTETGGTDPLKHSILSVAAVVWDSGRICDSIELLIYETDVRVTAEAMAINKIDIELHKSRALSPQSAAEKLEEFVEEHFKDQVTSGQKVILAGHNVSFDVGFIKRLYRLAGLDYDRILSHRTLDTAAILRFLSLAGIRAAQGADSSSAFAELDVTVAPTARHTALGDAVATATLLNRLLGLVQARAWADAAPSGLIDAAQRPSTAGPQIKPASGLDGSA
jgi:DNA polymerase-3 subunit epsilon